MNKKTESGVEIIEATGLEEAVSELELVDYDKHPEKRMRAAWNAFLEKNLPLYRTLYPGSKRAQLINFIQKDFKKSPENPVFKQQLLIAKQNSDI